MRYALCSLTLLGAFAFAATAQGDTLSTFQLNGTLENGDLVQGTVLIDTTSGYVVNANVPAFSPFTTGVDFLTLAGHPPNVSFDDFYDPRDGHDLLLAFPQAQLIGYMGGSLCSLSTACAGLSVSGSTLLYQPFTSVELSAVPEPATLALVLTGMGGVALSLRRRLS